MLAVLKFAPLRKLAVIKGVIITPLSVLSNNRGSVMHMLRCDDKIFNEFGEIYFSSVNPGCIKGWHCHSNIIQNFAVPNGIAHFALFDDRENSISKGQVQQCKLGVNNYVLLTVPPGIWYGFGALGNKPALVANCISKPFDPSETSKKNLFDPSIPFKWKTALD